jgi:plastocyanin domain-containing protein
MEKNIALSILAGGIIIASTIFFSSKDTGSTITEKTVAEVNNVEIRDGVQYVTITAKGGYSPSTTTIQPNMPTKLVIKTKATFDCSAALIIHSLDYEKMLQPNGEETIDIGTLASGEKLQGTCSMGMYNFKVVAS